MVWVTIGGWVQGGGEERNRRRVGGGENDRRRTVGGKHGRRKGGQNAMHDEGMRNRLYP